MRSIVCSLLVAVVLLSGCKSGDKRSGSKKDERNKSGFVVEGGAEWQGTANDGATVQFGRGTNIDNIVPIFTFHIDDGDNGDDAAWIMLDAFNDLRNSECRAERKGPDYNKVQIECRQSQKSVYQFLTYVRYINHRTQSEGAWEEFGKVRHWPGGMEVKPYSPPGH